MKIDSSKSQKGMVMLVFLCAILVLGVLTTYFLFVTSNAQLQTNVLKMKSNCQFLVENAIEEAFIRLSKAAMQPGSPEFRLFVEGASSPVQISTPLTAKVASTVAPEAECAISVSARIIEKRKLSSLGKEYSDEQEGLGSVELTAVATLKSRMSGKTVRRAFSHHDFRVASLVSQRDNRKNRKLYTNNFICDYLLFIRNGVQEFIDSNGKLLNRPDPIFKLNPDLDPWTNSKIPMEYMGKVFLGDRSNDGKMKHVFLNTSDETFKTLVPGLGVLRVADKAHCLKLFPVLEEYSSKLDGLVGYYMGNALPAKGDYLLPAAGFTPDQIASLQNRTRKLTEAQFTKDLEKNLDVGMDIFPRDAGRDFSLEYAQSLLEGDIRQRFLFHVHFFLDFMGIADQEYVVELNNETKHDLEGHFPVVEVKNPSEMGDFTAFYEEFPRLDDEWIKAGNYSLRGKYEDWFSLYHYEGGSGLDPAKINQLNRGDKPDILGEVVTPAFFTPEHQLCETARETLPFQLFELYFSTFNSPKAFYSSPYFREEEGKLILSLNGPVLIRSGQQIVLGGPEYSAIRIEGRGSIVAKGGFKILSPILKRNLSSALVLYAIGKSSCISLETNEVEAGLVAMNESLNGRIENTQPVTIRGFYACDRLMQSWNGADWPAGREIELFYDPGFKSPVTTLYAVGINRVPVLYKVTGDDA